MCDESGKSSIRRGTEAFGVHAELGERGREITRHIVHVPLQTLEVESRECAG